MLEFDLWSLSDLDSTAPGEKPEFCGVAEQRVTGVLIFLMIGLSVFFTPLLRLIPMPVLYGVFLYMGFSSLKGNQLVDRMLLFFMPQKHQPSELYLGCKTAPSSLQNRKSFFYSEFPLISKSSSCGISNPKYNSFRLLLSTICSDQNCSYLHFNSTW